MLEQEAFEDFSEAAHAVLSHLHQTVGFSLWLITRKRDANWIVLFANGHQYGVRSGDAFKWDDTCCSRMVTGHGPMFAPKVQSVSAYASAPMSTTLPIGAYIGVPLIRKNGDLFGTLCAITPDPIPDEMGVHLPLVKLLGQLLCYVLEAESSAAELARALDRAKAESLFDPLTELFNRRGWEQLLTVEEARHQRYEHPAILVSIDLDGLKLTNDRQGHVFGDALLRRTAEAIRSVTRRQDVVARVGGDEFAVLVVERDACHADQIVKQISEALSGSGISASVAAAISRHGQGFRDAWRMADEAMYLQKRAKLKQSHGS